MASQLVVCSQYRLSKFQEEEDDHSTVTGEPEVPAVNEDADATPITGYQREASDQASSFFLNLHLAMESMVYF